MFNLVFLFQHIHNKDSFDYENKFLVKIHGNVRFLVPKGWLNVTGGQWVGLSETGAVEREEEIALVCSSSTKIWFLAKKFIPKSLKNEGQKIVSPLDRESALKFKSGSSQWNSIFSRSDNWFQRVSISCAPSLKNMSFGIYLLPCFLRVSGTPSFEMCCFTDNYKLQIGRRISS